MSMKLNADNLDAYRNSLNRLIGKPCWSIVAGPPCGSHVSMCLGEQILRSRELSNSHLTNDQRKYDGEFAIFIESAAWRLDQGAEVITGSTDPNDNNGPMIQGLARIINTRVKEICLSVPGLDLTLLFDNELVLKIFCDQLTEIGDNYSYFDPDSVYAIMCRSRLKIEPRGEL
ncbi:MAG: hypothetical protein ACYC26_16345 [Phycisphaerales bacterium]